ncbi:hypothetical protein [Craterilacuibacter sinensis]|nr:hypothetical protein [Craterilacuibacter sinensis]
MMNLGAITGIRLVAPGDNTLIRRLFMTPLIIETGRYSDVPWR